MNDLTNYRQAIIRPKRNFALGVFQGFTIAILTLLCIEALLYFTRSNPTIKISYEPWPMEQDTALGYKLKQNLKFTVNKSLNEEIVYHAINSTDELGRRLVPGRQPHRETDPFVLFFGDSFTYGEGVADDQTLPFYFSKAVPGHAIYNYGIGGYGPQQMLTKLLNPALRSEIKEHGEAILVYTFIDHHFARVMGRMDIMEWGRDFPYYTIDSSNRLIRQGSFITGRPILSYIYLLMWKSQIIRFLYSRFNFPSTSGKEEEILTARIIEESRNAFRKTFHSDKFWVLIYPRQSAYRKKLIPYLEKAGIRYLDYSKVSDEAMEATIPKDPHPSPRSYQAVASRLASDLGL